VADMNQANLHHGTDNSVVQFQPAPTGQIKNWGQIQDVSRRYQQGLESNSVYQAPTRTHSVPSNDRKLGGAGTMPDSPPTHVESASQRARSVESFFVKRKRPSQPPPIMALCSASTNPIDTSLRKFQHGANSRYEQDTTYAMLWPPHDIQAEIGDLFVNTDSVTSRRRAWIKNGTGWAPIAGQ
jgi:hypothetical protein